ncbi:hypothetical protein [Sphingomonas cavernae]|uniref:Lipoprotein n=1 Tax=Sphingomonas cavernae TaxID=2320861 RepID=A0A418WLT2_9SPHN|nr:hypothetical protein [Sphingomonas cavernae]RJF90899.1 hypothetical protein D3876_12050 [Sphingomonas cavernae]
MRHSLFLIAAAGLLAACGEKTADNAAGTNEALGNIEEVPANEEPVDANAVDMGAADTSVTDGWVGKWVGVEGLALDVAKADAPGSYTLKVTLLDGTSTYTGAGAGEVIRFTRDGKEATLRRATGDETGLKYLAGKKDCLMIQPSEGFCRD